MRLSSYIKLTLCLAILIASVSCAKSDPSRKKLAFVTNNSADFWTIARKGCEQAAKDLGTVDVDFRIPPDAQAAGQRRIVDDLLAKGIQGMAISPVEPANQTQMLNDAAQKTKLITQDSDAPDSNRLCYIGTDNRAAGRQAGQLIKDALPNGGQIMIFVGKLDAQNAHDRLEGIKDIINGTNISIIDVRTDGSETARAKANAADTLVKYPTISCLVGLWGYNGPAILNAVKEANKVGQVKIVCFDEDDQTLAGVKDGSIFGTVVQQPYEFGYQAVQMLNKILQGDNSAIPANKQLYVPTQVINKANVDAFITKINGLRGRS